MEARICLSTHSIGTDLHLSLIDYIQYQLSYPISSVIEFYFTIVNELTNDDLVEPEQ